MEAPPELRSNRHWRMAVNALRVGFVGLAIALVGVVLTVSGTTSALLILGVGIWIGAAAITITGVVLAHGELPEPRPGFWPLRFLLLHDVFHPGQPDRSA